MPDFVVGAARKTKTPDRFRSVECVCRPWIRPGECLGHSRALTYALVVLARTGVDADLVARVDEEGHLDGGAGIYRSGLERIGRGCVALDSRLGVRNLHIDDGG